MPIGKRFEPDKYLGQRIVKTYYSGVSIKDMSKRFGVNPQTLRTYLASQGVEIRRGNLK